MEVKILVSGDIHLGRRSSEVYENAEIASTRYVWDKMVELAIETKVDFLALTGDIIDRRNRFFEAVGTLKKGFADLETHGIKVFMVSGNHDFDVLQQVVSGGDHPNVFLLGEKGEWETTEYRKDSTTIRLVGRSFFRERETDDPLATLTPLPTLSDAVTIGLVHGDVDQPDSPYAPLSASGFSNKGVDVWLLGHIHKPSIIREGRPHVRYPGSPQALSPKETGSHGVVLMTVGGKNTVEYEFVPLSPVRYDAISIELKEENGLKFGTVVNELRGRSEDLIAAEPHLVEIVFDVVLEVATNDPKKVEEDFKELISYDDTLQGSTSVRVRKVRYAVTPVLENLVELAAQNTAAGILAQTILALRENRETDRVRHLRAQWAEEFERIRKNQTYQPYVHSAQFDTEEYSADRFLLAEAERMLSQLLFKNES